MSATKTTEFEGYVIRQQNTTVKGRMYTRYVVSFGTDRHGRRVRRTFSTQAKARAAIREHRTKAEADAERQDILQKRIGEKAQQMTTDDLLDAARGLDILKGRASLAAAADFYVKHTTPPGGDKLTIAELCDKYRESREKAGRSEYTIADIRDCLRPFVQRFGSMDVAAITTAEIEHWFDDQNGGATRKYKLRNHLVSVFNYAVKRKYRRDNPASALEIPTKVKSTPHVLAVKDVECLMRYTAGHEPNMIPYMALCLFAGIRPVGEMKRLDWKDIDFRRSEIFVSDTVSKTNDERIIKMADNLIAWLLPYRQNAGAIFYLRAAFERIRKGAGVRWAKDCMRHTYGSMHLAMWQNSGDTAEQMGHTNIRILFNHYRRAVRKEDAETFWNIYPKKKEENVIPFGKAV